MAAAKRTGLLVPEAKAKIATGARFGKLVVLGRPFYAYVAHHDSASIAYVCECNCGNVAVRAQYQLLAKSKAVTSCGCEVGRNSATHGMSQTRLHRIWCNMKARGKGTAGPFCKKYYADRGIRVCREWRASFEAFRDWALANGYRDDLEIDRIKNHLGYSPDNCRWATRRQQMQNTRKRCDAKTSRYRGVSWCANVGKWRSQITVNGKNTHIGLYLTEKDAAKAYDARAIREFGEFASLNFPRKEVAHSGAQSAA